MDAGRAASTKEASSPIGRRGLRMRKTDRFVESSRGGEVREVRERDVSERETRDVTVSIGASPETKASGERSRDSPGMRKRRAERSPRSPSRRIPREYGEQGPLFKMARPSGRFIAPDSMPPLPPCQRREHPGERVRTTSDRFGRGRSSERGSAEPVCGCGAGRHPRPAASHRRRSRKGGSPDPWPLRISG